MRPLPVVEDFDVLEDLRFCWDECWRMPNRCAVEKLVFDAIVRRIDQVGPAVDKDTVAKYLPKPAPRPHRPPSQTWKTFVRNHLAGTIAIDFLTVPTVTFNVLSVFFVLSLERRCVLHVSVTAHPYAAWAAQQIVEAIGPEIAPARLIRDRDAIFAHEFDARVDNVGVRQIRISPRSPWQNGYAERWVGTLRRELLDHVIVLGERHLLRLVRQHVAYYKQDRPHMSLDGVVAGFAGRTT